MVNIIEQLTQSFTDAISTMILYLPSIIAALIILLIGWIAGRIVGKLVGKLLERFGLNKIVDKTFVGEMLKRAEITAVGFFEGIVRWFIYIIFIMAALSILGGNLLSVFMQNIALYIPHLVVGLVALIVGLLLVNMIMKLIEAQLKESNVPFANIIGLLLKAILVLVVIVFALDQLLIDTTVIYTFLNPLGWGIALGLAIAIGIAVGWGSKESIQKYINENIKNKM
jgi:small-conductance mechanosensitive channel